MALSNKCKHGRKWGVSLLREIENDRFGLKEPDADTRGRLTLWAFEFSLTSPRVCIWLCHREPKQCVCYRTICTFEWKDKKLLAFSDTVII